MTTQTYTLSKTQQLIDLNKDLVNFDVNFKVVSQDKKPFYALVIDQDSLDSGENIDYKEVKNGEISGNVSYDKNMYKNYFLILKSDEENKCDITIELKEIEANPEFLKPPVKEPIINENIQHPPQAAQPPAAPQKRKFPLPHEHPQRNQQIRKKTSYFSFKNILILAGVVIVAFLVYKFYFSSSSVSPLKTIKTSSPVASAASPSPKLELPSIEDITSNIEAPAIEVPAIEAPVVPPVIEAPAIEVPVIEMSPAISPSLPKIDLSAASNINSNLLSRLNSIPVV